LFDYSQQDMRFTFYNMPSDPGSSISFLFNG